MPQTRRVVPRLTRQKVESGFHGNSAWMCRVSRKSKWVLFRYRSNVFTALSSIVFTIIDLLSILFLRSFCLSMVFPHQHSEPRRQHARGQNLSTPSVFQESWREKEEKKEKEESHHLLSCGKQRSVSVLQRLIGEVLYLYIFSDYIHV